MTKPLYFGVCGVIGALAAFLPGEFVHAVFSRGPVSLVQVFLVTAAWTAVLGMAFTAAFVLGQNRYLHRPFMNGGEATLAFADGAFSGLLSGVLAQFFFSVALWLFDGHWLMAIVSRIVAWGIFGGLVGLGMAFVIPHLGKGRGCMAGIFGGGVGAVGFIGSAFVAALLFLPFLV